MSVFGKVSKKDMEKGLKEARNMKPYLNECKHNKKKLLDEIETTKRLIKYVEKAYLQALNDIRKWTKGRNVTKDSLRQYLNKLKKQYETTK